MPTLEYLDEERVKLWTKAQELETHIAQMQKSITDNLKKVEDSYAAALRAQKKFDEETRAIAISKTTEDAQLVMRTAQEVVAKKDSVFEQLAQATAAKEQLSEVLSAFKRLKKWDDRAKEISEHLESVFDDISNKKKESEKNANTVLACATQAQAKVTETDGICSAATKQAQNIHDVNEQVGSILAKMRDSLTTIQEKRNTIENLGNELVALKETQEKAFSDEHSEIEKRLGGLLKSKETALQRLQTTSQSSLKKVHDDYTERLELLAKKIEELLPGGTSIALSSAFEARKDAIEKFKWVWAALLAASALGLILFGGISLFYSEELGMASSWSARFIVVGGLVVIEEFSRRNYNVSSRLAEAYAYKETLAKSYTGYKNELQNVNMPKKSEDGGPSASVLVKTFLDKLADEPGKRVFDRERTALGLTGFLDHVKDFRNVNSDVPTSSLGDGDSQGERSDSSSPKSSVPFELFRKVSWPVVSVVGILAATLCIIAWILARVFVGGPFHEPLKSAVPDSPIVVSQRVE